MIRCYSDLHGILPYIKPCESLLIAGDVCPVSGAANIHEPEMQAGYLQGIFTDYCNYLLNEVCDEIVIIPGNHDFVFENPRDLWEDYFPEGVTVLIDEWTTLLNGITVWGSPWCPNLASWAFYGDEEFLRQRGSIIPEDIDIWLMHSPPYMNGDFVSNAGHVGNKQIPYFVKQNNPKFYVCGHIHEQFGVSALYETQVMNVSFLDDDYVPQWRHGIIDVHPEKVDGNTLMFAICEAREIANPREMFWSCRGELGL